MESWPAPVSPSPPPRHATMSRLAHHDPAARRRRAGPPPEPTINELSQPAPDSAPDGRAARRLREHHPLEDQARAPARRWSSPRPTRCWSASQAADDPVTRICFVNPAFTELLGWRGDELVGQSPGVLVGPGHRPRHAAPRRGGPAPRGGGHHRGGAGRPRRRRRPGSRPPTGCWRPPAASSWFLASFRDLSDRTEAASRAAPQRGVGRGAGPGEHRPGHGGRRRRRRPLRQPGAARGAGLRLRRVRGAALRRASCTPTTPARTPGVFDRRPVSRGGRSHEFRVAHRDGSWRVVSLRVADRRDRPRRAAATWSTCAT